MVLELKRRQAATCRHFFPSHPFFSRTFSAFCISVFTGTTIITCCRQRSECMAACCGPISICSSGFPLFHSPRRWMEQSHLPFLPTAVYGCILLLAAIAYHVLQLASLLHKDANPKLRAAVGKSISKGKALDCSVCSWNWLIVCKRMAGKSGCISLWHSCGFAG